MTRIRPIEQSTQSGTMRMKSFKIFGMEINSKRAFPAEIYILFFFFLFYLLKNALLYPDDFAGHPIYSQPHMLIYLSFYSAVFDFFPIVVIFIIAIRLLKSRLIYMISCCFVAAVHIYLGIFSAQEIHLTLRKNSHALFDSGTITSFGAMDLFLSPLLLTAFYATFKFFKEKNPV